MRSKKELQMMEDIYQAVRKAVGYDTYADELVDFLGDMYDNYNRGEWT